MIQDTAHVVANKIGLFFHAHSSELWKGGTGFAATMGAIGISMQEVEAWLRISSLCVGITVGLLTAWSILRKNRGDKK